MVFYQDWAGLTVQCSCQPNSDQETEIGKACFVNDNKCVTLEAIPNLKSGIVHGFKICGKRNGASFMFAQRPIIEQNSDGSTFFTCPGTTVPCDQDPFSTTQTVNEVLKDQNAKENKLICAQTSDLCPITSMTIRYDETKKEFEIDTTKDANNLPLSKFTISNGRPCLSPLETPSPPNKQFTDEMTKTLGPCQQKEFYGTAVDPRYMEMDVQIGQRKFEQQNGLDFIFDGRYKGFDRENTLTR